MSNNDLESAFSTFNGHIKDIPDILIDNFRDFDPEITKYCFVSHAHSDHLRDIQNCPAKSIITTSTTKAMADSTKLNAVLKVYPVNLWLELEPSLKFVFIPNYHCIGSMMILFVDERTPIKKNILYTGDVRFTKPVLGALATNEYLSPFFYSDQKLDWLYIDTTFTYRSDIIDIMDNNKGIEMLLDVMDKYPNGTIFRFLNCTLGFEEVWYRVQRRFKNIAEYEFSSELLKRIIDARICPGEETMINILKNIKDIDLSSQVLPPGSTFKFKIIFSNMSNEEARSSKIDGEVLIRHAIDLSKDDYNKYYTPTKDETIMSKGQGEIWNGIHRTFDSNESIRLKFQYFQNEGVFYPLELKFMYSRHSSYRETKDFIKMINKVGDIWPCTEGKGSKSRNLSMKRCYQIENSLYDQLTFPDGAPDDPLTIFNLWDKKQIQSASNGNTLYLTRTSETVNGDSTDEDVDVSILGRHQRMTSIQTSLDNGLKAIKTGKSQARKIQGAMTNTRDMARSRFGYNRVMKPNQWVIKRRVFKTS